MMLQLDCSDLIVCHAWIDNKKVGSSDGQSFTVESPDLIVTAKTIGGDCRWPRLLVVRRSWVLFGRVDWAVRLG
jgi:hypothetical protein